MNRTLRRPMFRMGGTTEGITSGLAPRQGYAHEPGHVEQGDTSKMSMMEKLQSQKSIVEALAPRQPRKDRSMSNFLIDFGLDLASRPPSGSIFSTAAAAAKDPFAKFQKAKQMETAYGMSETSEDRALIASLIKGMDEDELSAMMKRVKEGVKAGYYKDENDGIIRELRVREQGVQDAPGEADLKRIDFLEDWVVKEDPKTIGYARKVAEHLHKKQTGGYPDEIANELVEYPNHIKPRHWSKVVKPKVNEDGEIISFVIDGNYATTYKKGMYFEPKTGNIFKLVSKQGEAPVFVRVEFEQ